MLEEPQELEASRERIRTAFYQSGAAAAVQALEEEMNAYRLHVVEGLDRHHGLTLEEALTAGVLTRLGTFTARFVKTFARQAQFAEDDLPVDNGEAMRRILIGALLIMLGIDELNAYINWHLGRLGFIYLDGLMMGKATRH